MTKAKTLKTMTTSAAAKVGVSAKTAAAKSLIRTATKTSAKVASHQAANGNRRVVHTETDLPSGRQGVQLQMPNSTDLDRLADKIAERMRSETAVPQVADSTNGLIAGNGCQGSNLAQFPSTLSYAGDTGPKATPIDGALLEAREKLDQLEANVGALINMIDPILTYDYKEIKDGGECAASPANISPIQSRINHLTQIVETINGRVLNAISRVQL